MKESDTLASNVTNNYLRGKVWMDIKRQCIKESNTLVGNVANNFLRWGLLLNIKGLCMKESNTLADNVIRIRNFLQRHIFPDTRGVYIKVNKSQTQGEP